MDSRNDRNHWVKRNVQMLTFMDSLFGVARYAIRCFCLPHPNRHNGWRACQIPVGEFQQIAT
jgi:hypothetical protein